MPAILGAKRREHANREVSWKHRDQRSIIKALPKALRGSGGAGERCWRSAGLGRTSLPRGQNLFRHRSCATGGWPKTRRQLHTLLPWPIW